MTYQNDELTRIAANYQTEHDMSDEDMADKLNIDPIRYKSYATSGSGEWSFYEACILAEITGCSLDEIAGIGIAHSAIDPDVFHYALVKTKAAASTISSLRATMEYEGVPAFADEMLEATSIQLYEAARYFDTINEHVS